MITSSLDHTIRLIEDIQKVNPLAYNEQKPELDSLVQHMKTVTANLYKEKEST